MRVQNEQSNPSLWFVLFDPTPGIGNSSLARRYGLTYMRTNNNEMVINYCPITME